jgi:NTP pyrophosphatase (non-canonical NTP hydrolase)
MEKENVDMLFVRAIRHWGEKNQMLMAVEEATEMIQAILHYLRQRNTIEEVAEEVADVIIMAQQMRIIFGVEKVDRFINEKLNRLKLRIDKDVM